jgi:tRNA G18 (ribose-2'-O)-methylase SpoU
MPQIPIEEIDDPRLACYRDLTQRNLTRHSGLFIAEGDKVTERLIASDFEVVSILADPALAERYEQLVSPEVPIYVSSKQLLQETVGFHFHRGVVACGRRKQGSDVDELLTHLAQPRPTLVVCPDVQDPTNLGSIIRTCAAFGCSGLLLGHKCADPFSRRVLRVSMGAALQLPLVESRNLTSDLKQLTAGGFELVGAVLDPAAAPLANSGRGDRLALLLGSEGHGLTSDWLALCHRRVTIPMQLGIDSLNVAVAAAVLLYHFTS